MFSFDILMRYPDLDSLAEALAAEAVFMLRVHPVRPAGCLSSAAGATLTLPRSSVMPGTDRSSHPRRPLRLLGYV